MTGAERLLGEQEGPLARGSCEGIGRTFKRAGRVSVLVSVLAMQLGEPRREASRARVGAGRVLKELGGPKRVIGFLIH